MKTFSYIIIILLLLGGCTSQKKLAYLGNLSETGNVEIYKMNIPDYRLQQRDILYITVKGMLSTGAVADFLSASGGVSNNIQGEAGQFLFSYEIGSDGEVLIPVLGSLKLAGLTLEEARQTIQKAADQQFNNTTVECKLLSFKFTVIGEVRLPGTYFNYNNYLTVFEAIGRAGGIGDFGRRDRILVLRPIDGGTKTFTLNLQDKTILSSEAYFLMPNDVVIVEPESKKIFNLNLPTFSFILTSLTSAVTTSLLLINYFK